MVVAVCVRGVKKLVCVEIIFQVVATPSTMIFHNVSAHLTKFFGSSCADHNSTEEKYHTPTL